MNDSIESPPVFFLLIVSVTKDGQLNKIEICFVFVNKKVLQKGVKKVSTFNTQ